MQSIDYQDVIHRIETVYESCSNLEKNQLKNILQEISITGDSETLERLWLADFKEVPVSISEFISNPLYLGETNRNGEAVYPFWKDCLSDIFNNGNKYNEIVLSGATRIGKTSTSIIMMSYMLYRLMLYRDPHEYFKKKQVSKFTVGFANLTEELAKGVAYREFNDTLKNSQWFCEHGKFSRSDRNFYYIPEGDKIDIVAASDAAHMLGMQIWCLKGDTEILTDDGIKTLQECENTSQNVIQYDGENLISVKADVMCTGYTDELIQIELEDGTILEGTPDHRVMLSDGTYKKLEDLTNSDDLLTFNISEEVDEMNLKDKDARFLVYEHVSPNGKKYVGITSKTPEQRWLKDGKGYSENAHFWNAIIKYGWDNFEHNILATDLSLEDACNMEVELIAKYDLMNPDKGYNHTTGGNWSTPDNITRAKLSESIKERCSDPEYRKRMSEKLIGHPVSESTRAKISQANKGRIMSEEFRQKQRHRKHSPETIEKLKRHASWNKGLTKETDPRLQKMSESMKGRKISEESKQKISASNKARYKNGYSPRWITNGVIEKSIQFSDPLPEGFEYGRLSELDTYIFKGDKSKKINNKDTDKYLSEGWKLGRPVSVCESIRKSRQKMHWIYEGQRFESANDLADYLNDNGYPNIVGSTITSLYLKGFENSPRYSKLSGKIERIDHENKIN